jgi:lauroyl/myristoyl acyltransferase
MIVWCLRHCPWLARILRPVGVEAAWQCARETRRNLLLNAAHLLGELSRPRQRAALGRQVLRRVVDFIADMAQAPRMSDAELSVRISDVLNIDSYREARALGRGVIVITAHFGSFELGLFELRRHERQVHVVFQRDTLRQFETLRRDVRRRFGVHEAPVDDGLTTWMNMREALQRDEVVLMQADRVMPGQAGIAVPFFDGTMRVPAGPVKLAIATGAPIVPIFARREADGRVRIVIEPPMLLSRADQSPAGIEAALRRVAACIERHVRSNPEQWMALHRAWCEDQVLEPAR